MLPGTARSGQKSPKVVSVRDGTVARLGADGGAVAGLPTRCGCGLGHGDLLLAGSGGGEREIGPDAGAVLTGLGVGEADRSVVQVGDPAGDREAQTGPATTVDVAEGPEPFEGTLTVRRRDAGALVGDLQLPAIVDDSGSDRHRCARRAVPGRVVQQVGDQLAQAGGVALDGEVGRAYVYDVADVATADPGLGHGGLQQRPDLDGLAGERRLAGVDPREVEQIGDQARHPLSLVQGGAERFGVGIGDAVGQVLQQCAQRG